MKTIRLQVNKVMLALLVSGFIIMFGIGAFAIKAPSFSPPPTSLPNNVEIEALPLPDVEVFPGDTVDVFKLRVKKISLEPQLFLNQIAFTINIIQIDPGYDYYHVIQSSRASSPVLSIRKESDRESTQRHGSTGVERGMKLLYVPVNNDLLTPLFFLRRKGEIATLTLSLRVEDDFNAGAKFQIKLTSPDKISPLLSIKGDFPFMGPKITVKKRQQARIEQGDTNPVGSIATGSIQAPLFNFKITANQADDRVMVRKMTIKRVEGLGDLLALTNIRLLWGSVVLASPSSVSSDKIVFDINNPIFGANKLSPIAVSVVADVPSNATSLIDKKIRLSVAAEDVTVDRPDRISGSTQGNELAFIAGSSSQNNATSSQPAANLTIVTPTLPDAIRGQAYTVVQLEGQNGATPYQWILPETKSRRLGVSMRRIANSLPSGLILSSDGIIRGSCAQNAVTTDFDIQLKDANGASVIKAFIINVR